MVQSMIERVARAMAIAEGFDDIEKPCYADEASEHVGPLKPIWQWNIPLARAAISAMRITEDHDPEEHGGLLGGFATFGSPAQIWNARIDEALGEGGQ